MHCDASVTVPAKVLQLANSKILITLPIRSLTRFRSEIRSGLLRLAVLPMSCVLPKNPGRNQGDPFTQGIDRWGAVPGQVVCRQQEPLCNHPFPRKLQVHLRDACMRACGGLPSTADRMLCSALPRSPTLAHSAGQQAGLAAGVGTANIARHASACARLHGGRGKASGVWGRPPESERGPTKETALLMAWGDN